MLEEEAQQRGAKLGDLRREPMHRVLALMCDRAKDARCVSECARWCASERAIADSAKSL